MSVPAAIENGPCFKRKPWIPPPARTTKEDAPRESNRATSAGRKEPSCPGENMPSWSSSSSGAQTLPRSMVQTEKAAGTTTAPGPNGMFSCTDAELAHPRRQGLGQKTLQVSRAAPSQLAESKLSQVVKQLEAGCEDLTLEVQQHEEAAASARHTLELAQSHVQALRAIHALTKEHWDDPDNRSAHFKDKVAELKIMLAALRDRNESVPKISGMINCVWEQVVHIFSEELHSCSANDDLLKHLNLCLKEKEALVAGLERELGYQEVRVEREQIRHKRCLEALEVAHRQHRDEKNILRGRLRSMDLRLDKCRTALDHTALLLNQREKELAQARRYQLEALAAGGHLQETLDMVQKKLVELEPMGRAAAGECKHRTAQVEQNKSNQACRAAVEDEGRPPKHQMVMPELAKAATQSKDHGCRHSHKTEKYCCKRCCGDGADSLLKHVPTHSRNHQFERMQVDGEGRIIQVSGIHTRDASDGPDKEKEKLRRQVAELQERLNRVEASNRNLTSYIASLRQSYAAVFKDTPESSIRPEDEDASLVEDC